MIRVSEMSVFVFKPIGIGCRKQTLWGKQSKGISVGSGAVRKSKVVGCCPGGFGNNRMAVFVFWSIQKAVGEVAKTAIVVDRDRD